MRLILFYLLISYLVSVNRANLEKLSIEDEEDRNDALLNNDYDLIQNDEKEDRDTIFNDSSKKRSAIQMNLKKAEAINKESENDSNDDEEKLENNDIGENELVIKNEKKSDTNINEEEIKTPFLDADEADEKLDFLEHELFLFTAPISLLGLTGNRGDFGAFGPKGEQGPRGIPGSPGIRGALGKEGKEGRTGNSGLPGPPGMPGTPGSRGEQGDTGLPGEDGSTGPPGNQGFMGVPGEPSYGSDYPSCVVVCENEKFWLECKKYEVLNIITTYWGRDSDHICPNPPQGLTTDEKCTGDLVTVEKKIFDQCNDKQACQLIATNLFFDDNQCPNVYKYLSVCYECNPTEDIHAQ